MCFTDTNHYCCIDLMAENHTLRNLLRSLANFIGDGAGGLLPKLGWEMSDFNAFINKSETDTAWEGYQKRKKQGTDSGSSVTIPSGQKRAADDEPIGGRPKKSRSGEKEGEYGQNGFPLLTPVNAASLAANGMYPGSSRSQDVTGMFSDLMRSSSNSPGYMQQTSPADAPAQYSGSYQPSYIPGGNIMEPSFTSLPFNPAHTSGTSVQQSMQQQSSRQTSMEPLEDDGDPNKNEAYKLVHYHLENFKRNNNYCLPSSLRPTIVQKTVPHESVIDVILHAELRDRMILLRERYDLVECLMDYRAAVIIHGDDVLAHTNWEIGEQFLRKYGFLIDAATLNIANRWRRERGEPEIRLSDIGSVENTPPT